MNIFCGKNTQGKTNLIEAIWLCSGEVFSQHKDREMIDINGRIARYRHFILKEATFAVRIYICNGRDLM